MFQGCVIEKAVCYKDEGKDASSIVPNDGDVATPGDKLEASAGLLFKQKVKF